MRGSPSRLGGELAAEHRSGPVHRHAVLHLLSGVLAAAGASRTMLFLDDLQHVDDDTLALADVLATAPAPRGVLLLAAHRPRDDERLSAIARANEKRHGRCMTAGALASQQPGWRRPRRPR